MQEYLASIGQYIGRYIDDKIKTSTNLDTILWTISSQLIEISKKLDVIIESKK